MVTTRFYLKEPSATIETAVFMRISYSGQKIKYYISESIEPKNWNSEEQRAKSARVFKQSAEFNARLDNIENLTKDIFRRYQNDHKQEPTPGILKKLLDAEFKGGQSKKKDFWTFFDELIVNSRKGNRTHPRTGKPISGHTIKTYVSCYNHLQQYQKSRSKKIDFNSIDMEFYIDLKDFMIIDLRLANNSMGKYIQILKTVLGEALEYGLHDNLVYKSRRFQTIREDSDNIYLSEPELQSLYSLDLTAHPRLEKVRDMFLIGCYTGLRFSDYSSLSNDHIKGNLIEIKTQKTQTDIVIPLYDTVRTIIAKYNGNLPKPISNQKTNEYLKEIARMIPEFHRKESISRTKAGQPMTETIPIWQLISTHTARRSFATNLYISGFPAISIMKITGHKTEKAFLKYIKISNKENAIMLLSHWAEQKKTSITRTIPLSA